MRTASRGAVFHGLLAEFEEAIEDLAAIDETVEPAQFKVEGSKPDEWRYALRNMLPMKQSQGWFHGWSKLTANSR